MWEIEIYYYERGEPARFLCAASDFSGVLEILEKTGLEMARVERIERLAVGPPGLWVTPEHKEE